MNEYLKYMIEEKDENFLFPFFWVHKGHSKEIPERIQKIFESGCRAFCVESRPHEDFGKQGWWDDMEVILQEARKRDMKVWLLDDKHFPTGYANGILENKYQELRRWFLREHHVDIIGPMKESSVLLPVLDEEYEEKILAVVAYRRSESNDTLVGDGILLTDYEQDFLFWDVPEGTYRIFFIIQTRKGSWENMRYDINGLDEKSVHALIESVYESHYEHFGEYFGNTLVGFFSDEPGLYTEYLGPWGQDAGAYYRTIGQPGIAIPWSDEVTRMMLEKEDMFEIKLPGLWYSIEEKSHHIRLEYMDLITILWQKNFSMQLGEWCRSHDVLYTGHIVEDMNAHMRLGFSTGHYFRGLSGQDMSGIDIVLHQVLPGFAEYDVSARIANGTAGNEFFHYVLPKLGSSLARIEPRMQGRAMCEVFGAYGWAEDTACMKWLIDFLFVRGINRFVPHAFDDVYPDLDCPPHFYAQGQNPQFEGFSKLINYINQVGSLLEGTTLQTSGAIFYMAEAEWLSSPSYRTMDEVAKVLYDAHVDFDILPLDALQSAELQNQKLIVNGKKHDFLVIPYAERYPIKLYDLALEFVEKGIPIFWIEQKSNEVPGYQMSVIGEKIFLSQLIPLIRKRNLAWMYTENSDHLRIGHFKQGNISKFLVFWEDVQQDVDEIILFPRQGSFLRLDLLNGNICRDYTENGQIRVKLSPYQSEIIYFDIFENEFLMNIPPNTEVKKIVYPELLWKIYLLEQGKEEQYRFVRETKELFSITGKKGWPCFSGRIKYQAKLYLEKKEEIVLFDLGKVGGNAKLSINGKELGIRICQPYSWDISNSVQIGENQIEIEVANTLVHRIRDDFSRYMAIAPSGLLGPVKILYSEN